MKKLVFLFLLLLFVVLIYGFYNNWYSIGGSCTEEAKICQDGTGIGREGYFCLFKKCPELIFCDVINPCPDNMECYKFQDNDFPYCFSKDKLPSICKIKCGTDDCDSFTSYPPILVC